MSATRSGTHTRRWLTRTVLGIGLASLLSDLSHEVVTTLLPQYLLGLGVTAVAIAATLGMIEGMADGVSSVAKLFGGWLADRLPRRKPLCAGGYGFMALATLLIAAATIWPVVLVGRALAWLSRGIRTPPRKALLAEAVAPEAFGRAFGFERAMDTLGAIAAPLIVWCTIQFGIGARTTILWSVVPAGLAALAIAVLVRETPGRIPVRRPLLRSWSGFGGRYWEFLAAVGLFGIGDFADTFYILYAMRVLPNHGFDRSAAAGLSILLYALHNVLYAALSYGGGWLADHFNKRLVLVGGYLAAASAAMLMLCEVESVGALSVLFAVGGCAVGLYEAVEDALAAELLPNEIRGSGYGALAIVIGSGDFVSSLAVGWLWSIAGGRVAFGYAVGVMLAGAALMAHLARRATLTEPSTKIL